MSKPNELSLCGYVNPIQGFPCFVVPIFSDGTGFWVQDVGDDGKVLCFLECDIEKNTLSPTTPQLIRVGDDPLYGFAFEGGEAVVSRRNALADQLRHRIGEVRRYPFLHADVARFIGDLTELAAAKRNAYGTISELNPEAGDRWWRENMPERTGFNRVYPSGILGGGRGGPTFTQRSDILLLRWQVERMEESLRELQRVSGADDITGFAAYSGITLHPYHEIDPSLDAVTVFAPDLPGGYRILISPRIIDHPDPVKRSMLIRRLVAHELAHIISKDPADYYTGGKARDPRVRALSLALETFARDSTVRQAIVERNELLAMALTFFPMSKFVERAVGAQADIRMISEAYRAPLDWCAKWTLLSLALPMHYIKYDAETAYMQECYIPEAVDEYSGFLSTQDLSQKDSVAYKAMATATDLWELVTSPAWGARIFCRAFYVPSDPHMGAHAQVIVTGYPEGVSTLLKQASGSVGGSAT